MMKLIRRNAFTVLALLLSFVSYAQVTTSNIIGTVKAANGEDLSGATITAVHQPSGTKYVTTSKRGGTFNLPALRTGGPYTVSIEFVGYSAQTIEGFNLTLGEPFSINVVMGQNTQQLTEVVVGATKRRAAIDRTGASTNISNRQLATLPSISRSLTDFTRLTPQAGSSVSTSSNSFGGRDGRYNNVQVDGANLNNNFGLSTDPLPGGGNQPISLDAIDQVSINISPYDVRQANFTGAGINAITKSGTNTFHGSAYGYSRNQSYNGTDVAGTKLAAQQKTASKIYGATLGGPIIKNKLFFFASAEFEKRTFPGIQYTPKGGSGAGRVSDVPIDSLRKLSNYLKSKYGYETGAYDNYPNFASKNHKYLARIDWNISNVHKLTLKYNELVSTNDVALNAASIPNGAGTQAGYAYNTPSFDIGGRVSTQALSFANSNYGFKDVVRSATAELNSNFGGRMSNQLLATLTKIRSTRTSPSTVFPFIDILNNNTTVYMSAGYEPYSYNNDVINNVYSLTDNFSYYVGKHSLTAGGSYEYQRVGNMFMAASQSYYAFNSLDDFVNSRAPRVFAYTYSLVPGEKAVYSAELKIGQLGFYAQDEINVNPRFKVTVGVRFDRPIYLDQPLNNPAISALNLPDKNGNLTHYSTGQFPKSSFYASPRAGFRWDPDGDKNLIIRGGTGIFTGRIPFVFLTNIPTNSGMYQFAPTPITGARTANYKFNANPDAYRDSFPSVAGTSVPGSIALANPNFKFPQVWRTNLAVDKQMGHGWALTLEALYTKDINAVWLRNANQKAFDTIVAGAGSRPRFSNTTAGTRRVYAGLTNAIVLENTKLGSSASITAQVSKSFANGLYGSVAYTYSFAQDVTANPGSQAASVWSANPTSRSQNDLELANSGFSVPHRIVGTVSYRFEYLKHLGTTVSLFYEGAHQGRYSYIYNGDLNQDGNSSADLIYIPKDPSEINFAALAASGTTPAFTAQQQSDAFFQYVNQDPYLKKHKGQFAERNGALLPFYHRMDLKFLQDLFVSRGPNKHTLQFSLDALNFLNLLNHDWGIRSQAVVNNPLTFVNYTNGRPNFRMATYQGQLVNKTFINTVTTASTWSIQLGLRYSL